MTIETVFQLANLLVLPQWMLLVVAPHWRFTHWLIQTKLLPGVLALLYMYYLLTNVAAFAEGSFSRLTGVATLFSHQPLLLAGWVHYLTFDLLPGSWMLRNGQSAGISHGLLIPCLVLCFLLGPTGWLLYGVIRFAHSSHRNMSASSRLSAINTVEQGVI
jgi:hypothetical protein